MHCGCGRASHNLPLADANPGGIAQEMKRTVRQLGTALAWASLCLGILASGSIAAGHCRRAWCSCTLPYRRYQTGVTPLRGTLASYPTGLPLAVSTNTTKKV